MGEHPNMPKFYYATTFCDHLNAKNMAKYFVIIEANNACSKLKRALCRSECTPSFHFWIWENT